MDLTNLSTGKTLLLLQSASSTVIEILSCHVTDLNNSTAEQWNVGLFRVATLGSPTGTSLTPEKHEAGDQASAATALGNLTSEPSAYDAVPINKEGVSNLAGYHYDPIPEERCIVPPSGAVSLVMLQSLANSTNIVAEIVYREIG